MSGRCRPARMTVTTQKSAGCAAGNHRSSDWLAHTVKMADGITECSSDELRRVLREQAGLDLIALAPAQGGESKSTFWATDRAGTVSVLKDHAGRGTGSGRSPTGAGAVLARLRDRGYPAPRFRAIGHVPGLAFWVQQRMPGDIWIAAGKNRTARRRPGSFPTCLG